MRAPRNAMTDISRRAILRPPEAVLFDMDGVLVDTFEAWVAVLEVCRARRGLSPLGEEGVRATWGQGVRADCNTIFLGEDPALLAREYSDRFPEQISRVVPEEGVLGTVRAIRRAGIRTAVVTNSPVFLARLIVDRIGLAWGFDCLTGGDEVSRGKPDPDIVLLTLRRLGAEAPRAVLVGDTRLDIEAARAAGVPVIGYHIAGGDARIDRLLDLLPLIGLPPLPPC